ncbi:MAG: hypothetical protein HC915_10010 [Anaerolineae bacterium]|nr:hypothetical protein [Anaerolineae bacterium]
MKQLSLIVVIVGWLGLAALPARAQEPEIDLTPPELGSFDPASVEGVVVEDYPLLPAMTEHARAIYARGQAAARNPRAFSKIGDCMTASEEFMTPFGTGDFDLGEFAELAAIIAYFAEEPVREIDAATVSAFDNPGLATASGFNTASLQEAIWANPNFCEAGESPLSCEYRVSNPAWAIIMLGTNDILFIDPPTFDYYLRSIVLETINSDVVPILNTFPTRLETPERTRLYNQIIIQIALDYDLPLINLWLGLQSLPFEGVDQAEPIHLSSDPEASTGLLTPEGLEWGYNFRNLVTLQALDTLVTALDTPQQP